MRSSTRPLVVRGMGGAQQACTALEPVDLKRAAISGGHDESWIQDLIDRHPSVLPLADIEPGLANAEAVCRELPTPSGFVDNLLMTREGGIVVVEAKLWRNPQARREVVGQILDYAKDLKRWRYEELEGAVQRARRDRTPLAELVVRTGPDDPETATFIDAVSRNLRLGRFLCVIAGDGIQESAEQLADFIQQHVGLHFTLSMVELSLWRMPGADEVIVTPRVILRTIQIERPVVSLDQQPDSPKRSTAATSLQPGRAVNISEAQFYEQLGRVSPDLPTRLFTFLTEIEDQGVRADVKKAMSLKWRSEAGTEYSLGLVQPADGLVHFDYCNWAADSIGRLDLSHRYLTEVAALLEGGFVRETPKATGWNVKTARGWASLGELLQHGEKWRAAIARYILALRSAEGAS